MSASPNIDVGYCLNVHPGATPAQVEEALFTHAAQVAGILGLPRQDISRLSAGLWLNEDTARHYAAGANLDVLRDRIKNSPIDVVTCNGFPMGVFGAGLESGAVKEAVYRPDWSSERRLRHTKHLANILARLLPRGRIGSISTLPVTYRAWADDAVVRASTRALADLVDHLYHLHREQNALIVLALEPEPDCLLEDAADAVRFWERSLLADGLEALQRRGHDPTRAEELLRRHLGVCLDVAHEGVVGEDPRSSLRRYADAGIRVVKLQLGAALTARGAAREQLRPFAEPVYLHQTRLASAATERRSERAFSDLDLALDDDLHHDDELRVHFHVPLSWPGSTALGSTRELVSTELLNEALAQGVTQLEVEVYTLGVWPEKRLDVTQVLADDIDWVLRQL